MRRRLPALLLLEEGRFLKVLEDEPAEQRAEQAAEEHEAPAPYGKSLSRKHRRCNQEDEGGEQRADAGAAAGDEARHHAAPLRRHRFGAYRVGGSDHAANEYALHEAQNQENHRREDAGLRDGRQRAERCRRDADADESDQHRALATVEIGIMAEQRRPDRAHQQRHGEGRVDRGERQRRKTGGKEQRADDWRDVKQDEQVEQVERKSEHGRDNGIDHLPPSGESYALRRGNIGRSHCPLLPLVRRRRSTEIVQYAAELVWRSTSMLSEEACEIALSAEAERIRNDADPVILLVQAADGRFDTQRVEIEPRAEADAGAEQMVEMRAREAGDACHAVEIERAAGAVAHVAQRAADAEITGRT